MYQADHRRAFDVYLRTGLCPQPIERKFNPWHDPRNGRFTFRNAGNFFAGRSVAASGGGGATGSWGSGSSDPRDPANRTIYVVRKDDTLSAIAKLRKGLTAADLAWINRLPIDRPIQIGQRLMLPTQAYLERMREARATALALIYYSATHDGKLPPDPRHPPSIPEQVAADRRSITANGYRFDIDLIGRTQQARGVIVANPNQSRSRAAQRTAGGRDRLPTDHGGHYIARRFNGPTEAFNHFAQDANFNRSGYASLENQWAAAVRAGRKVRVDIRANYEGLSQRPSEIIVIFWVDGKMTSRNFKNRLGE